MMKKILKLFLPKASTMANIASETICNKVNESNKGDIIAKYTAYAKEVTEIQTQLVKWLADGTLDKTEQEEIAKLLQPIFEKVIDLI